MSALDNLASSVRALAHANARLSRDLADSVPRLRELSFDTSQQARMDSDPHSWTRASRALEQAAAAVALAANQVDDAARRATAYAAYLTAGGSTQQTQPIPVPPSIIDERTTANRINLADDVPDAAKVPDYGGYLDVVMHGDADGTAAAIGGKQIEFTIDQVEAMVRESEAWDGRAVRMLSCSTGQANCAQDLANRLGVAVYAPSDVLSVAGGVKKVLRDGEWRRFEPRP